MSCRKLAGEYVSTHLHGLAVIADAASAATVVANSPHAKQQPHQEASRIIATHNGSFHCDEALACGLLRHTAPYRHALVMRTRDPAQIAQADIVVDVGAVYAPEEKKFDHHQSSFHGTMTTDKAVYKTRLSSAGLVYKHFGKDIIARYVNKALTADDSRESAHAMARLPVEQESYPQKDIDTLFDAIYKNFIEQVDGIDNGVEQYSIAFDCDGGSSNNTAHLVKNYTQSTTLSDRVGKLQTWWNEAGNNNAIIENALFAEAMEMASREFFETVSYFAFSWLPARALVEEAFAGGKEVHPSGKILVFRKEHCPWKDHLFDIENEQKCVGQVLYVVFSDGKGGWRVQAVPKESSGFANRKSLPFKGLRDEELSKASGIAGGVFVHVSGFIGGMETYEGAIALAIKGIEMDE